jgi:hypothetical protein
MDQTISCDNSLLLEEWQIIIDHEQQQRHLFYKGIVRIAGVAAGKCTLHSSNPISKSSTDSSTDSPPTQLHVQIRLIA